MRDFVVIRDFTRPTETREPQWLYRIVSGLCAGQPMQVIDRTCFSLTRRLYESESLDLRIANWPKLFSFHSEGSAAIHRELSNIGILVGYELADSTISFFEDEKLPYINFVLHPIRFLPDVCFSIQTNITELKNNLEQFIVPDSEFYTHAALIRASRFSFVGTPELSSGANLFICQVPGDKSLIDGLSYFSARVDDLPQPLWQKPHPYASESSLPSVPSVSGNLYHLYSTCDHLNVYALSSSALIEANYFGHTAHRLMPSKPLLPAHRPVFLDVGFWRKASALEGTSLVCPMLPPNTLRTSLQSFWGYHQLHLEFFQKLYAEPSKRFFEQNLPRIVLGSIRQRLSSFFRKISLR